MKKRILLQGPILSQSGYGYQTRFALRALRTREEEIEIFLVSTNWGHTSWLHDDDPERKWIDQKLQDTITYRNAGGTFDAFLQVTIPLEIEQLAPINILYTAGIETTHVAPEWLNQVNLLTKMIVVSNHSKQSFRNSSYQFKDQNGNLSQLNCSVPIDVVNYSVQKVKAKKSKIKLDYDFNFITVAQWSPRKNLDNLIKWFVEEFKDEYVGLVVKTSQTKNCHVDRILTHNRIKELLKPYKDHKCKVYMIHGSLTDEEMFGLYKDTRIKAYVSTTHGEGFGLPLFEAAQVGLPIVSPAWSGQSDFLFIKGKEKFASVDFELKPIQEEAVWDKVLMRGSHWCFPKEESFKRKIRDVFNNTNDYKEQAKELADYLNKEFNEDRMYGLFVDSVMECFKSTDDEIELWLNEIEVHE